MRYMCKCSDRMPIVVHEDGDGSVYITDGDKDTYREYMSWTLDEIEDGPSVFQVIENVKDMLRNNPDAFLQQQPVIQHYLNSFGQTEMPYHYQALVKCRYSEGVGSVQKILTYLGGNIVYEVFWIESGLTSKVNHDGLILLSKSA